MVDERIPGSDVGNTGAGRELESRVPENGADTLQRIRDHVSRGGRLWLFLDYDGTLVPYAATPAEARPDAELTQLLKRLVQCRQFRTVILSGRALASLQAMLDVPGLLLAGLYGLEVWSPDRVHQRVSAAPVRAVVERVISAWTDLVKGRPGFLVEDKGLSVALHARLAGDGDVADVMPRAQRVVADQASGEFRIFAGNRFLEIAPATAHKGLAVEWLLNSVPFPDAWPIYFGDDDKDEEAFVVIRKHNGIPVVVGAFQIETNAEVRVSGPSDTRRWLQSICEAAVE